MESLMFIRKSISLPPDLSSLTPSLLPSVKALLSSANKEGFKTAILNMIFSNKEKKDNFFLEKGPPKLICGKLIKFKDMAFKCLDCEKDETCIICQECFENSDHKGHRIIPQQSCGGCCDCGDEEAWKKEGFCSIHKGYSAQNSEEGIQIDEEVQKNIKNTFKNIFYCIFENAESFLMEKENLFVNIELSQMLMETVLLMRNLIGDNWGVNKSIFELLSQPFNDQKFKLFHDCTSRERITIMEEEGECSCSILENLFRFLLVFEKKAVKETVDLLITLFPNYQFKVYLTRTYGLMFQNFYFEAQYYFSNILDISVQLFTSDEICKMVIENNDMDSLFSFLPFLFENIKNKMEKIDSNKASINLRQALTHIEFMTQKAISAKALSLSKFFWEQIFKSLFYLTHLVEFAKNNSKNNQKKKKAFSDLNFIDVELSLLNAVKETLKHVTEEKVLEMIFSVLIELIKKKNKNDLKEIFYSFHNSLNRALAILMNKVFHFPSIKENLDYLSNFLSKAFCENNDELSNFLNCVGKSTLQTIEFIKKLEINLWKASSEEYELYSKLYYIAKYYFYDCDLFLIQVILVLSKGNFMKILSENFKLKNEYQQLTEKSEEIDYTVLESWLLFLIEIYDNKLPLCNVGEFFTGNAFLETEKKKQRITALKNFVYKNEEINLKLIKKDFIGSFVLEDPKNVETILDQIADFNNRKKVFRLKEDKDFIYNPFIFSRNIKLYFEFSNARPSEKTNRSSLSQTLDLEKKSFFYMTMKYSLEFISELILKLLRENNELIFKNQNLRIIIFKIINDKLNFNLMKKKKVYKNLFMFEELLKIIQNAKNSVFFIENSKDFNYILTRISEICNHPSHIEIESTDNIISNPKIDVRRLEMIKRQTEIKKKFEEKQNKFLLNERHEIQSKKEEMDLEKICVICKDSIYTNEKFGGFCYFSKSNLIQHAYSQYFTKASLQYDVNEINELSKLENWGEFDSLPTFSNCQHFIHEKCYESYEKFSESKGRLAILNNCPLCAKCFNLYLPNIEESENKSDKIDIFERINKIDKNLIIPLDPLEIAQSIDNNNKSVFDFFDNILSLVLLYPDISQEDDLILSFIEKTFISLNYFSDLTGILYIIRVKLELYQNFKRLADLFVASFLHRAEKQSRTKRIDFVFDTLRLFEIENWRVGEDLDLMFIKFVLYSYFYFRRNDEELHFICKNLFCQVIVLKCIQSIIYNEEILSSKVELSPQYLVSLLLAAPKKSLLSLLKRQLSINSIFFGEKLEIDEILFNELTTEQEEFSYLCEVNKINFQSLIQNYIQERYEEIKLFLNKHIEGFKMNSSDKHKSILYLNESLVNFQLCFNLTNLDPQFANVHSLYSTKKCDLCNDYPHFGQLCLCLICGATICSQICNLKGKSFTINGNLNEHSQKFHNGNSIFISTLNGAIFYVAFPQNFFLEGGLYQDRFGDKIKIKQQKLDTYFLNVDEYNKVKDMIVRNEIEEKIETISRKEGIKFQLSYF